MGPTLMAIRLRLLCWILADGHTLVTLPQVWIWRGPVEDAWKTYQGMCVGTSRVSHRGVVSTHWRAVLIGWIVLGVGGCTSTPAHVSYKGLSVPARNTFAASCRKPTAFEDCNAWKGPKRLVQIGGLAFRVAGSTDGRQVIVMTDRIETQLVYEQAATQVERVATDLGAKLVRVEGLASFEAVDGYVLTFDRDVYSTVKTYSVSR